jgi:hypothetical protein
VPLVMIILRPDFISAAGQTRCCGSAASSSVSGSPSSGLGRRKSSRLKAFNSGLADTIMLLANSLRAGSSFLQSGRDGLP